MSLGEGTELLQCVIVKVMPNRKVVVPKKLRFSEQALEKLASEIQCEDFDGR